MAGLIALLASLILSLPVPIIVTKTCRQMRRWAALVFVWVQAFVVQIVVALGFAVYCFATDDYAAADSGIYTFSVWILALVPYYFIFKATFGHTAYWKYGPPKPVWVVVDPDESWVCTRCGKKNMRIHGCIECGAIPYITNPQVLPQYQQPLPQTPAAPQTPTASLQDAAGEAPVQPPSQPAVQPSAPPAPPQADDSLFARPSPAADAALGASEAPLYCRFCGKPLDPHFSNTYCPSCGKRLDNAANDR